MQEFEIFRVVRDQGIVVFPAPAKQLEIGGPFAESIFGLLDTVSSLSKHPLEDPADVFVEEDSANH